jgi:hypothetical protein
MGRSPSSSEAVVSNPRGSRAVRRNRTPLETIMRMPAAPARFVRQPTRCFSPFLYSDASDFYLHLVYDLGVEEPWSTSRLKGA